MREIIAKLSHIINTAPTEIARVPAEEMSERPAGKWSKKEILGHLCDSAANNHHRFVRIQFEEQPFEAIGYDQTNWVKVQDYQSMTTREILNWWVCLNNHLLRVLTRVPEHKYLYICETSWEGPVTLVRLAQSYLDHMEHHLKQITL